MVYRPKTWNLFTGSKDGFVKIWRLPISDEDEDVEEVKIETDLVVQPWEMEEETKMEVSSDPPSIV